MGNEASTGNVTSALKATKRQASLVHMFFNLQRAIANISFLCSVGNSNSSLRRSSNLLLAGWQKRKLPPMSQRVGPTQPWLSPYPSIVATQTSCRTVKEATASCFWPRTQLFGVVRHTERADGVFAFWENGRWSSSEDCRRQEGRREILCCTQ